MIVPCLRPVLAVLALLCLMLNDAAASDGVAVEISNQSQPVLCAEKDNVAIAFAGAGIAGLTIAAMHPAYIGMLRRDSADPNWTGCDMSGDPSFAPPAPPHQITLYDGAALRIIGFVFDTFWRKATTEVRIGERVERTLHMLQFWVPGPQGWEEVLVLYPPDGYWRARPLAPEGLTTTAYGSSFLIGPIEQEGRPLVRIDAVVIDSSARSVLLRFARGGSATVAIRDISQAHNALAVSFDPPISGSPFAMLRSMYVTETNNDVARFAVRETKAAGWREGGIMDFDTASATEFWAGRVTPSRHNTSAPDMLFDAFRGATPTPPVRASGQ